MTAPTTRHDGTRRDGTGENGRSPLHWRFARSHTDRLLSGVAGGLATRLGVDPLVVRAAFAILSVAGGLGIVLYLIGVAVAAPAGTPVPTAVLTRPEQRNWAVLSFTLAALLLLRRLGFWIGDGIAWPLLLVIAGSLLVSMRRTDVLSDARRLSRPFNRPPASSRIVFGLLLAAAGVAAISFGVSSPSDILTVTTSIAAVVFGVVMVAAPWVRRTLADLGDERRARIRSEEKAALSAHLHDSVLQTLTLIQRNAGDPETTVRLARQQERELRDWLYQPDRLEEGTVRSEFDRMVREVESTTGLAVDAVYVGDATLTADGAALVQAAREALVNVAKHAGVNDASLYVETDEKAITAFVRDRGCGFDVAATPADRHGISESIRGRLERQGGTALVSSSPGNGTEVEMTVRNDGPMKGPTTS